MFKIKTYVLITFSIISSSMAFANPAESPYFIDHAYIKPGKSLSANYTFPTADATIECTQDQPASHLGAVEWKYKNITFKGQIGDRRVLTLMRADRSSWWTKEQGQTADPSGNLIISNFDNIDLEVSCRYSMPERKNSRG